jgi:cytidine deaminase
MTAITDEELVTLAVEASKNAVAHHSNFHVGAALQTADGTIYTGCNVESDSFGLTICAERVALTKALSEGERKFSRIAVFGEQLGGAGRFGNTSGGLGPCGACRQLLWEHCGDVKVIGATAEGEVGKIWRLAELLPDAFDSR